MFDTWDRGTTTFQLRAHSATLRLDYVGRAEHGPGLKKRQQGKPFGFRVTTNTAGGLPGRAGVRRPTTRPVSGVSTNTPSSRKLLQNPAYTEFLVAPGWVDKWDGRARPLTLCRTILVGRGQWEPRRISYTAGPAVYKALKDKYK